MMNLRGMPVRSIQNKILYVSLLIFLYFKIINQIFHKKFFFKIFSNFVIYSYDLYARVNTK